MKKAERLILILTSLLIIFSADLCAQSLGLFAGANMMLPSTDGTDFAFWDSIGLGFGWSYGLWLEFPIGKKFIIETQLVFSQRTLNLESALYGTSVLDFSNMDLFILFGTKIGQKKSKVFFKPFIGLFGTYLSSCSRLNTDADPDEVTDWTYSWQTNFNAGPAAVIIVDFAGCFLMATYCYALVDMCLDPVFTYHVISLSFGIKF